MTEQLQKFQQLLSECLHNRGIGQHVLAKARQLIRPAIDCAIRNACQNIWIVWWQFATKTVGSIQIGLSACRKIGVPRDARFDFEIADLILIDL